MATTELSYCARPHERFVDFDNSRFVVGKATGLNIPGEKQLQHLEMGDEIPRGVLSAIALRQEYDTPLANIELIEFAMTRPELREACARRGVTLTPPKPIVVLPDLNKLSHEELILLCTEQGVEHRGSAATLRKRLAATL